MKRRFFLGVMAATPVAPALAVVGSVGNREEIEYLGEIQRVTIKPGDVLVATVEQHISSETAERIKETLRPKFPGHTVLVLGSGMKLGVVGA